MKMIARAVVTDAMPGRDRIHTGAGQIVVTGYLAGPVIGAQHPSFQTPAVGTFYVAG